MRTLAPTHPVLVGSLERHSLRFFTDPGRNDRKTFPAGNRRRRGQGVKNEAGVARIAPHHAGLRQAPTSLLLPALIRSLSSRWRDLAQQTRGHQQTRDQVRAGIERLAARGEGFTISELEQTCPGVSRDMVRRVLREQQAAGVVECRGRGPGAAWVKKG